MLSSAVPGFIEDVSIMFSPAVTGFIEDVSIMLSPAVTSFIEDVEMCNRPAVDCLLVCNILVVVSDGKALVVLCLVIKGVIVLDISAKVDVSFLEVEGVIVCVVCVGYAVDVPLTEIL